MNWLYRHLLRVGDRLFKMYCFLLRPKRRGAYIAVWWDGRVLLVENSYRTALTLPSGGINSHETPLAGARRELKEEVGIEVEAERIKYLSNFTLDHDNIRDDIFVFELVFKNEPDLHIDNREVTEARFESLEAALSLDLSAVAVHILKSYSRPVRHQNT